MICQMTGLKSSGFKSDLCASSGEYQAYLPPVFTTHKLTKTRQIRRFWSICMSRCCSFEACFASCGVLIVGHFNRLVTSSFKNFFQLKQNVKFPMCGNRSLNPIFSNMKEYYKDPVKRPVFGLSDHAAIKLQPLVRNSLYYQETYGILTRLWRLRTWRKLVSWLSVRAVSHASKRPELWKRLSATVWTQSYL